jgi:hypothetical protein
MIKILGMTGLNARMEIVGREQDRVETEREGERESIAENE